MHLCAVVWKIGQRTRLRIEDGERLIVLRLECAIAGIHRDYITLVRRNSHRNRQAVQPLRMARNFADDLFAGGQIDGLRSPTNCSPNKHRHAHYRKALHLHSLTLANPPSIFRYSDVTVNGALLNPPELHATAHTLVCNNSNMRTVFTAERLWDGTRLIDHPIVIVEDGRIISIGLRSAGQVPGEARVINYPRATLGPAFFDVHIHGAAGHDVM